MLRVALIVLLTTTAGCASLGGTQERYLVCPYDTMWETSLEMVKDRPIVTKDKAKGLIETGWTEVPVDRSYGILQRELRDAKDRTKVSVALTKLDDVTKITLVETRERWKFRGGSRLFGWDPAEPSEEDIGKLMTRLTAKLKERGCRLT